MQLLEYDAIGNYLLNTRNYKLTSTRKKIIRYFSQIVFGITAHPNELVKIVKNVLFIDIDSIRL